MLNNSFSPWPSFTAEEVNAVARVLSSNRVNYWTGEECRQFEREFAEWAGSRRAIAMMNGTVALDSALRALGIGPGDEVVVTPRSFMASASCVVTAGAIPVFADVDADSQNLSAETIHKVLTSKTRAVICVHLAGLPCDMDPIMELAREKGLKVIEDCAQAHGAKYRGRMVGTIGDVGAWSFCQDKIITTGGEGGMVTTDDEELWSRMWSYKDHGKSWEAVYERTHPPGYRFVHDSFGTNWRMLELQAVLGRMQLQRLEHAIEARTANAQQLAAVCAQFDCIRVAPVPAGVRHAYYRFYAFVCPERLASGWSRDRIVAEINAQGVPCFQGTCSELYLEKAFDGTPYRPSAPMPVARELGLTSLSFLVHPTLSNVEMGKACDVLHKVLRAAGQP